MKFSAVVIVLMAFFVILMSLNILLFVQYQNILQAYNQLSQSYTQLNQEYTWLSQLYTQLNQFYSEMNKTGDELAIKAYVLKEVVVTTPDPLFSPPVSMYKAIKITLENHGWNVTPLIGMIVGAHLDYMHFWNRTNSWGSEILKEVTEPVADYSPLQNETGTYRYIWQVVVSESGVQYLPQSDLCLIDASSGEIIRTPILITTVISLEFLMKINVGAINW
jgi:hypothetical protein